MNQYNVRDINVLDPDGDSYLGGDGIGHIVVNENQITQVRCGIFAVNKPIPINGKTYLISGVYDDNPPHRDIPFKVTLPCTNAGRPQSTFG